MILSNGALGERIRQGLRVQGHTASGRDTVPKPAALTIPGICYSERFFSLRKNLLVQESVRRSLIEVRSPG